MQFTTFDDGTELARWLAKDVAGQLSAAIEKRGTALLAVSGGKTPVRFFRELSAIEIDWSKVNITLADERFVSPNSGRSNQRLVTVELLQNKAAKANFLPLYTNEDINVSVAEAENALAGHLPLDVIVLGMGVDGHTASLFPGADALRKATDPQGQSLLLVADAPGAEEPRITMTLPAIAAAGAQYLHFEGQEKRKTFEAAQEASDPASAPIGFVLEHCPDLKVVWAR
ncbi:6-phosphogluconolactonase [Salaquimonas pukyongi]|uniref:6-phosphogluconolactonase n=1 Tax=Salaquimonas pukyongi TaxID=2712698 RepID=UPI00096BB075|nr:6-phosphogluconolactonase [Salaquimonas pukyongi]